MKKTKIFVLLFLLQVILAGCGTMSELGKVMRNEKENSTDEFLIQKKEPLTKPPDFNKLPQPNTVQEKVKKQEEFQTIFKSSKRVKTDNKDSSIEESILKKIK